MSEKKFKTMKNRSLGASRATNLTPGDIVSWKTWQIIEKKLETIINYGTILNIYTEMRGQREVFVADVLCSKTGKTIKVNLLRLYKK